MALPRVGQSRRRDANESSIVRDLRKAGVDVCQISGAGAPDLLLRFRGVHLGVEVKTTSGRRTKAQEETQWPIIRSAKDAMLMLADAWEM